VNGPVGCRVCVIVPFQRWSVLLDECVGALLPQLGERDRLVLSGDLGSEVPDAVRDHDRVRILESTGANISRKRNLAIESVPDAEVYACLDSDAVPEPGWIEAGFASIDVDDGVWMVGGPDIPPDYDSLRRRAVANAERSFLVGGERTYRKHRSASRPTSDLRSANLFIARAVIDTLGGFDESLASAEDAELSQRVVDAGKTLYFCGDAVVRHHTRALVTPYLTQKVTLGYGAFRMLFASNGVSVSKRVLWSLPAVAVVSLSLAWIPGLLVPWWSTVWLVGAAWYLLIVVLQAAISSRRPIEIPATALAVAIGNLGPGIGFVSSFLKLPIGAGSGYRNDDQLASLDRR
jgi:cellulose synthase/poly-beta-1,6-N-acetylglucosamine synthase-like glycosyltransferase